MKIQGKYKMAGRFLVAQFLLVYLKTKNYVGLFLFSDGNDYPELTYVPLGSNENLFTDGFLPGTAKGNYNANKIDMGTWGRKKGLILTTYQVFKGNISFRDFSASVFELNGKNITITPSQKIPLSTDVNGPWRNIPYPEASLHNNSVSSGLPKIADGKFFYILGVPSWTENSSVSLFSAIVSVSSNNIVTFENVTAIDETSTISEVYSQTSPPAAPFVAVPDYYNVVGAWWDLRVVQPNKNTVVVTFVRLVRGYFANGSLDSQLAEIHFYAMAVNLSGNSISSSPPIPIRPAQIATVTELPVIDKNTDHQVTAVSETAVVTCYIVFEGNPTNWLDRRRRFLSLLTTSGGSISVGTEIEIDPFYTYIYPSYDEYKTWLLGSENYLIFVYTGCLETDIEDFDPNTNYTVRMLISLIKKTGSSFELLETIDTPYNNLYNRSTNTNDCHFIKLSQDTFCGMNYSRLSNNPNTGEPIEPHYYMLRVEDDRLICSETFPIKDFDLLENQPLIYEGRYREINRI